MLAGCRVAATALLAWGRLPACLAPPRQQPEEVGPSALPHGIPRELWRI